MPPLSKYYIGLHIRISWYKIFSSKAPCKVVNPIGPNVLYQSLLHAYKFAFHDTNLPPMAQNLLSRDILSPLMVIKFACYNIYSPFEAHLHLSWKIKCLPWYTIAFCGKHIFTSYGIYSALHGNHIRLWNHSHHSAAHIFLSRQILVFHNKQIRFHGIFASHDNHIRLSHIYLLLWHKSTFGDAYSTFKPTCALYGKCLLFRQTFAFKWHKTNKSLTALMMAKQNSICAVYFQNIPDNGKKHNPYSGTFICCDNNST